MKIKLSKSQWESIGKTAGWMKTSQIKPFDHKDPSNYAPGETPYTDEEWRLVRNMIGDAAKAEEMIPQDELEDATSSRKRYIKVTFSDGDYVETWINGTVDEIIDYYMPEEWSENGKRRGPDQDYSNADPSALRHVVKVEFLD